MIDDLKDIWTDLLRADSRLKAALAAAFEHGDEALIRGLLELGSRISEAAESAGRLRVTMKRSHPPAGVEKKSTRQTRADRSSTGPPRTPTEVVKAVLSTSTTAGEQAEEYPRFHWEDDKLIKVGWSDEKGKTYRHGCPLSDVLWIARRLAEASRRGSPFRIGRALKPRNPDDPRLKNHQKYACLDWLKKERLLVKDEDGNYTLGIRGDLIEEIHKRRGKSIVSATEASLRGDVLDLLGAMWPEIPPK